MENTIYEIRVKNHLDPCWHDWFDGWTITNLEDDVVLLTGANVDQSALHGALNKIRDLNLKLISAIKVTQPQSKDEYSAPPISRARKSTETS